MIQRSHLITGALLGLLFALIAATFLLDGDDPQSKTGGADAAVLGTQEELATPGPRLVDSGDARLDLGLDVALAARARHGTPDLSGLAAALTRATPVLETPVPATTVPATTVPATTVHATTVPATTVPATTVPATTVPATTVPATTVPATTVPATTVPATTVPVSTVPDESCGAAAGPIAITFPGTVLSGLVDRSATDIAALPLVCGPHTAVLVSADLGHGAAAAAPQPNERWLIEFVDGDGATLLATDPSDDLADAELFNATHIEVDIPAGATGMHAVHVGAIGEPNTVVAVAVVLIPVLDDAQCGTPQVRFPGHQVKDLSTTSDPGCEIWADVEIALPSIEPVAEPPVAVVSVPRTTSPTG